jgi:hypothetical protein
MVKKISAGMLALALVHGCGGDANEGPGVVVPGIAGDIAPAATGGVAAVGPGAGGANVPAGAGGSTMVGAGGVAGSDMQVGTGGSVAMGTGGVAAPGTKPVMAMDECGLNTKWEGDEYCIKAPPPDQGFQIHIGPSNYDNPEPKYVMAPGAEVTEDWPVVSGNTTDKQYYFRQYRMRPHSHHLIVYTAGALPRRLGGTQNLAKDNPDLGIIPPESQGIGMPLAANSPLSISLHYINLSDKPIIKEAWVNFWYRDPSVVKESAKEMFSFAPMNILPGTHILVRGTCPITQAGRILTLYGHVHANNSRFSAWRVRGAEKLLLHESFNWEEPLITEFSSLVTNSPSDASKKISGGYTGVVDLKPGDSMIFECDITNKTSNVFRGQNEALNDEMCIMVGDSVGAAVPALCQYTNTPI